MHFLIQQILSECLLCVQGINQGAENRRMNKDKTPAFTKLICYQVKYVN